jgi:uncharacterized protein
VAIALDTNMKAPGLYIVENIAGPIAFTIAGFDRCYVFLTGDKAGALKNQITNVSGYADFTAQHGVSKVDEAIKSYFVNLPRGILQVINVTCSAAGLPTVAEYTTAINTVFAIPELTPAGFMCFPQIALSAAIDNVVNSTALRKQVYDVAIAQAQLIRALVVLDAAQGLSAVQAIAEATTYVSDVGHITCPYWPFVANDILGASGYKEWPPSLNVIAVAFQKYRDFGLEEAPAGIQYPLRSVYAPVTIVNTAIHQTLVDNVNVIRYFPKLGTIVWGSRVRSNSTGMRFVNERVGLNVIERTIEENLLGFIFRTIDGRGYTLLRIRTTIEQILELFRLANVIYGSTPDRGYQVICDSSNNPDALLANGFANVDAYIALSPPLERLRANLFKVAIGQVQTTAKEGFR